MLNNHGLAATGVGTVDCARHNMKLPNAVGDLQKGEWCVLSRFTSTRPHDIFTGTTIWTIYSSLQCVIFACPHSTFRTTLPASGPNISGPG